jgi:polyphosphate kinase 2 (PPK2 family)
VRREGIPQETVGRQAMWKDRYRSIVDFEKHLHRNGTQVLKFFLHLSKEEQRRRFLARIDAPHKNWKFSLADVAERRFWRQYMHAYEDCLGATSTKHAPWHVVPADDKYNARLIISRVVIKALRGLEMRYPKTTRARRIELRAIGKRLKAKRA